MRSGARRRRAAHRDVRAHTGRRAEPARPGGCAARGRGEIYRVGGAQAIAALAYGTPAIARVDRIIGPGNAYVAEAKRQVFGPSASTAIAGPSEVVILADAANDPRHVAIDLLAQAEHDEAAQAILITDNAAFADAVAAAVMAELATLPRAAIAGASWRRTARSSWCAIWDEAAALGQPPGARAPATDGAPIPPRCSPRIRHAGAVVPRPLCPEAVGDYIAGPNHVLPDRAHRALFFRPVGVRFPEAHHMGFRRRPALRRVGPAAIALARGRGAAHAARAGCVRSPCCNWTRSA